MNLLANLTRNGKIFTKTFARRQKCDGDPSSQKALLGMTPELRKIMTIGSLLVCLLIGLTGCKEQQLSVDYLLQHPIILENELKTCMTYEPQSDSQVTRCKIAAEAHSQLLPYLNSLQREPEAFGQQILTLEMEIAKLKEEIESTPSNRIDNLNAQLTKLENSYAEKQQQLKILLAVASLSGPE